MLLEAGEPKCRAFSVKTASESLDPRVFQVEGVASCSVGAFGVVGNLLTIMVLRRTRTNRSFNNLLVALGVVDLAQIAIIVVDMSVIQVRCFLCIVQRRKSAIAASSSSSKDMLLVK